MSSSAIVYIAYDRFPAPKGAAVHIDAFVRALASTYGKVDLVTVSSHIDQSTLEQPTEYCRNVDHYGFRVPGKDLMQRVLSFRQQLNRWWKDRRPRVVHFRSIYEGYPIAKNKSAYCDQLVYEVNGLPSIELKYHYPDVADDRELIGKLEAQEQTCLDAADLVVTVSDVNARYLLERGVPAQRLRVIPNGVDPERFGYQRPRRVWHEGPKMFYSGTLASWQGVRLALDALALYRRDLPATLTLVGEGRRRQVEALRHHAHRRRIADAVHITGPLDRANLARVQQECDIVVAPLLSNDRNVVQGCCPLKVLEAMASGTPLIASNLPVVRALARDGWDALLVRPGSAKAIKDAMVRLGDQPGLAAQLSASARRRVKQHFTWSHAQQKLLLAYEQVLGLSPASNAPSDADSCAG